MPGSPGFFMIIASPPSSAIEITSGELPRPNFGGAGLFCAADFHYSWAAVGKGAAGRDVRQVRRLAWDRLEAPVALRIELRKRFQQPDGVRMLRRAEYLLDRPLLHDLAGVHYEYAVARFGHDSQVV